MTPQELRKISVEIGDIWYEVGLELDILPHELDTISHNNPSRNEKASLDMLIKWRSANENISQGMLNKAIRKCRAKGGTVLDI